MKKLLEYLSLLKGYKLYLAILFFFIIWMAFFDANSILTHHELNKEREKLNKQKQFLKKEIEKEYLVRKEESSIKIEDGIDRVSDIIEEKEEKNFLPSEIREKNIIEKFFNKITNVIKSIFS